MSQDIILYRNYPQLQEQGFEDMEVRHDDGNGTLFFNPRTGRTYRVTYDNKWYDVSLAYPVDDITDFRIRAQNMQMGASNYMPQMPVPLPEVTQDIDYEEVP